APPRRAPALHLLHTPPLSLLSVAATPDVPPLSLHDALPIYCTVDSMSTTTPRRSPRDSWLPMPITSIGLPGEYSPTSATTLEVPMSRPTINDLSPLRFMYFPACLSVAPSGPAPSSRRNHWCSGGRRAPGAAPAARAVAASAGRSGRCAAGPRCGR